MNTLNKVMVSPHIHSRNSTFGIMLDVIVSLVPALFAGDVVFGFRALVPVFFSIACCVGSEAVFNYITKKKQTIRDLSAVVTGLLLGLGLPADVPLWQCATGSLFAIIIVKCIFGGIGCNAVNPAITARVFMLVSFGAMATPSFPVDSTAGATPLSGGNLPSLSQVFFGNYGGSIGETCTFALLLGGIYLLFRRVITWHVPVVFIGTVYVFTLFVSEFDVNTALCLTMSGSVFIGAIFMATDYVTSPFTEWGKVIYALGCGLLTSLIRYFGSYPEGVSFAILFMNILTPFINEVTRHKVFASGGEKI